MEDGESALMAVGEFKPDVIILDINMPGMNGLEVCERLQTESETTRKIPIIFLTGSKTDINKAFELGGVDYIIKPFNTHEVLARVNVHVRISFVDEHTCRHQCRTGSPHRQPGRKSAESVLVNWP